MRFLCLATVNERRCEKIVRNNVSEEDASKQEMLQKCRQYYRDNISELRNIDEFDKTYIRTLKKKSG